MSYFRSLNWSLVNNGFGKNSKKKADNFAKKIGKGIKIFFFFIEKSNFSKISLKEISSGPTHSIISEYIFFSIIERIIPARSETCNGENFVLPL